MLPCKRVKNAKYLESKREDMRGIGRKRAVNRKDLERTDLAAYAQLSGSKLSRRIGFMPVPVAQPSTMRLTRISVDVQRRPPPNCKLRNTCALFFFSSTNLY